MKKILYVILISFLCLTIVGCDDNKIPMGTYKILDKRIEKTSLVGKYVSIGGSDVFFFEIFDNYAILSDSLEEYIGFEDYTSKTLEINIVDKVIYLGFNIYTEEELYTNGKYISYGMDFYSKSNNTFIWEISELEDWTTEDMLTFKRQ